MEVRAAPRREGWLGLPVLILVLAGCVTPAKERPAITLESRERRIALSDVEDPAEREDLWRFADELKLSAIDPAAVKKACKGRVEGQFQTTILTIGEKRIERYHGCLAGSATTYQLDSFMLRLRAGTRASESGAPFECRVKNDPRCKLFDASRAAACLQKGESGVLYAAVSYLGDRFLTNDFVWMADAPYARRQKIEACFRDGLATLEIPFEFVPGYPPPLNAWLAVPLR